VKKTDLKVGCVQDTSVYHHFKSILRERVREREWERESERERVRERVRERESVCDVCLRNFRSHFYEN